MKKRKRRERVKFILFYVAHLKIKPNSFYMLVKGQSISKFDFTTMKPQVDLFSFDFRRKSATPKNYFEIN